MPWEQIRLIEKHLDLVEKRIGQLEWWIKLYKRTLAALAVALIAVIVIVVLMFVHLTHVGDQQASDEQKSCKIQASGLPAGHALATVIVDLHLLLTQPRIKGRPPIPPQTQALLDDLNSNAARYGALEGKQPHSRSC